MEMKGEQRVPATQQQTWDGLNDPEVLKACVPGCESIEKLSDTDYQVFMTARVGPVSAKFKGKLTLSDLDPPRAYSIAFEGQGGVAGFGKGSAQVQLAPDGDATTLSYAVNASVGGKLAQIGSRLVDAASKKLANDFFRHSTKKWRACMGRHRPLRVAPGPTRMMRVGTGHRAIPNPCRVIPIYRRSRRHRRRFLPPAHSSCAWWC